MRQLQKIRAVEEWPFPPKVKWREKNSAYVDVPAELADELIASGQAEPTEEQAPTHELVPDEKVKDGMDRNEADWALDEAAAEDEDEVLGSNNEKDDENPEEGPASKTRASAVSIWASEKLIQKLPFPVIVPQCRPGTKTHGFVRANPPVLGESVFMKKHSYVSSRTFTKLRKRPPSSISL